MGSQGKTIFVTVGTTSFDALIQAISSQELIKVVRGLGFSRLVLQYGRGTYEPPELQQQPHFTIEAYRFKDSIAQDIRDADLVISHAGAGSCLETLGAKKPLLVVINELLMGNHQLELATQLYENKHLFYTTPSKLAADLKSLNFSELKPFPPGDPSKFASFLDKAIGLS